MTPIEPCHGFSIAVCFNGMRSISSGDGSVWLLWTAGKSENEGYMSKGAFQQKKKKWRIRKHVKNGEQPLHFNNLRAYFSTLTGLKSSILTMMRLNKKI